MMDSGHIDLTNAKELIPILQRHGFYTNKSLGQHFLISRKALQAIISACNLEEGLPVLEIGPGVGTVTRELAELGAQITAIELDKRAITVLADTVGAFPNVQVVQGDIMKINLETLLRAQRWTVVGNLPYYITTPVISRIIDYAPLVARAIIMVQREVADRLLAPPGSKLYGSLSVFVQVYARVERMALVPAGAFLPPPTVNSAVVRLTMYTEPLVPLEYRMLFFQITRAAFGQRRKTLENTLMAGGILGGERLAVSRALASAGVVASRRGETLSIDEFLRVTKAVAAQ